MSVFQFCLVESCDLKLEFHFINLQRNYHSKLYKIYLYSIAICVNRHNFLSLQVVMKMIFIKVASVMALVWYSLGIIGFDVHKCNASGRSFIATFVEGISCEDIHPDHGCGHEYHGCNCAHHHSGDTAVGSSDHCCTDDYQALTITGSKSDSSRESEIPSVWCLHYISACLSATVYESSMFSERIFRWPDSGYRISDCQAVLSVWRI